MLLCSNALVVAKVIGGPGCEEYPALPHRRLLTEPRQFEILHPGWLRGPNAIRSIEEARVHHAARRSGGVAARGEDSRPLTPGTGAPF